MKLKNNFSANELELKKIRKILKKINKLAPKMKSLSDNQLKNLTPKFKKRLKEGQTLDDILPEAFAAIREADRRILGMFPFDVQVIGAIVLHQGNIAEMKTGEGKTLTATLPLYLNALTGKGAILVTVNEYLALRDCKEMGEVYRFMGLSAAAGFSNDESKDLTAKDKRKIYNSDIVYTTNAALGFDYLFENIAGSKDERYLRPYNYAIIDEADQVLLDEAQMPLVISGAPRVQSNLYNITDTFITTLKEKIDYEFDEEETNVWLTDKGIDEAQRYFSVANLFAKEHNELLRHIVLALRAHELMEEGKNYLVIDDEVKLLDERNGRILSGNKLSSGLHQAIEAKEHVKITPDMRSMASITYQNLFRMFNKLAGMTGTGKVAQEEFINTYYMKVIVIPTNKPVIRKDYPNSVYTTLPEKLEASMALLKKLHKKGQPVLLITPTVEISEIYSEMLLTEHIAHSVLNAHNAAKEAEIIKEAGQLGNVTVATTMAGRGTDIKLGKGVSELGGLAVIGTELLPSKREDLQLRGRAGRQGDPGMSKFFVSLEDEVVIQWSNEWLHRYYDRNSEYNGKIKELTRRKIVRAVKLAQETCDSSAAKARQGVLEFDESARIQRNLVYKQRDRLIEQDDNFNYDVLLAISEAISLFLKKNRKLDYFMLSRYIFDNLSYRFEEDNLNKLDLKNISEVKRFLLEIAKKELDLKKKMLGSKEEISKFYRVAVLKAIDSCWVEEVDNLQQLRTVVSSRQYAQRDTKYEYHKEVLKSYNKMRKDIKNEITKNLLLSSISKQKDGSYSVYFS